MLRSIVTTLSLTAIAAVSMTQNAVAAPVQWTVGSGGNGHYYELVQNNLDWTSARSAALGSSHLGMSGYLANVTSAAEQAFLDSINPNVVEAWLGGSDMGTEGSWLWMDGPEAGAEFWSGGVSGSASAPFNYAPWISTEPNDSFGNEDALVGWWTGDDWNDLPASSYTLDYYVVEYGGAAAAVAEPMTLGLFGLGLAGLGIAARRRR